MIDLTKRKTKESIDSQFQPMRNRFRRAYDFNIKKSNAAKDELVKMFSELLGQDTEDAETLHYVADLCDRIQEAGQAAGQNANKFNAVSARIECEYLDNGIAQWAGPTALGE